MKYLCIVLYLLIDKISFKACTIDVNIQDLVYVADHLTAVECRQLFASLHFVSYDLPVNLNEATQKVPIDEPCVKLLIKWNSGEEVWEGKSKTHNTIEHRLRQLGKNDLADWLGKRVFHQLANHINTSLEQDDPYNKEDKSGGHEIFRDPDTSRTDGYRWTTIDSVLSVALSGLLIITLIAFMRMLKLTFRRANAKRKNCKHREELIDLISADSMDSDQETVYELDMEKQSRVSFAKDLEKAGGD